MKNITVLGAGVMGHGIAQLFAQAGKNVYLYDIKEASLEHAEKMIHNSLKIMAEKEIFTEEEIKNAAGNLSYTTDLAEAVANAEFVVEVVPEILDLKWETFEKVENLVSEDVIIASNTSAIPLTELIQKAKHPERFVITHFFNPPQLVPLVEIVKDEQTDEKVVQAAFDLMKEIGSSPVILKKEVPGFIANRIQLAILREAFWLLENEVATAEDIDTVMKASLGFRYAFLGPLEGQDLSGLNTPYYVSESLFPVLSDAKEPPEFLKKWVEDGQLGIRSGKGFYTYEGNEGEEKIRQRDDHFLELLKLRKKLNS